MSQPIKSVVITFLGNAYHDSRVVNLIDSLTAVNIDVITISFDWKSDNIKTQVGRTSVFKLNKSGSSLSFYFKFLFILIKNLLIHKPQLYFAEDIYTLPVVFFFAKWNKSKIYYNSREIYAHLAGLRNKDWIQSLIAKIESIFIKKVDLVLVTGEMDAEFLRESYRIDNFFILRNLPKYDIDSKKVDLHEILNIPSDHKIILYQGVVLEGRGILKIIDILDQIPNTHFVIIGDGEYRKEFMEQAGRSPVYEKIHFIGAVNHSELLSYTKSADVGLALIENISISYYYALPNKLFEYIMAGIPVISSNLPQMKKVIDEYQVGKYVDPENKDEIVHSLNQLLKNTSEYLIFKEHCKTAAKILNWDNEFNKFKELHLN